MGEETTMTSTDKVMGLPRVATRIELTIGGMTCASCASRVEKKLNRMQGVTATVNYATEKASVTVDDPAVSTDDLIATVEKTGYTAALPEPPASADRTDAEPVELRNLRT